MIYKEIPKNSVLKTGKYRFTFKANLFQEQIVWLIDALKGLVEETYEVIEGKRIRIYNVSNEDNFIFVEFELLENPVPVAVIVGAILGLLALGGLFLVLDKVEEISETPLGTGIGVSLSFGTIALIIGGGLFLYKNFYAK